MNRTARALWLAVAGILPASAIALYGLERAQGGDARSAWVNLGDVVAKGTVRSRIERNIDPRDPIVTEIADAVRRLSRDAEVEAQLVAWQLPNRVDYTRNQDLWPTRNYVPTLAQVEASRLTHGWRHWRGDCKTIALLQCSVLRALGFQADVETSFTHAWTTVRVAGKSYALNGAGETSLPPLPSPATAALLKRSGSNFAPGDVATLATAGVLASDGKVDMPQPVSSDPPPNMRWAFSAIALGLAWFIGIYVFIGRFTARDEAHSTT